MKVLRNLGVWFLALVFFQSAFVTAEYRKPGADIELLQPQAIHLEASETRQIELAFTPPKAGQILQIRLLKSSGLQVLSPETQWQFAGEEARVTLQVSALVPGKHRLQFLASIWPETDPRQSLRRALGVLVTVLGETGDTSRKLQSEESAATAKIRADGRRTVEFIADETVR